MNASLIPLFKVAMAENAHEAVAKVLSSGMVGEGPEVARFQQQLANLFDHPYVVPVSSCTASLSLALQLAGAGFGDEVISSPFTMVATSAVIKQAGCQIRWCDIEPDTLCADVHDIRQLVRPGITKAIIVTCVGGLVPRNLEELAGLGVPVILDCAHALNTTYRDEHISHWADYCCFSFQAIKALTTGDGGALTVRDRRSWERAEKLKWFGLSRKVPEGKTRLQHQMTADVTEVGYKYHLNDIAAAIGLSNFDLALANIEKTRAVSNQYIEALQAVDGIRTMIPPAHCNPSWWLFGLLARDRDRLINHLEQQGIAASPMWVRNDHYTAFRNEQVRPLPVLDEIIADVIFIPNGWWLSGEDTARIISAIRNFY